jgi:TonB family protein
MQLMKRAVYSLILLAVILGGSPAQGAQLATFKEVSATVTDIGVPQYPESAGSAATDETVTVGIKVLQDGSVTAVALEGAPAFAVVAVDAARQWRFASLPKPEHYPFRFRVSFSFKPSAAELEIRNEGDTFVIVVPKGGGTAGPVRVGDAVLGWFAIKREFAPYPADARAQRTVGTVIVGIDVDSNGRVTKATGESGPMLLRGASERAARGWRFRPLRVNGQPVPVRARLMFNFAVS